MMGAKMERDMRRELFDHYQELSFSYYSRNNSGQMMSKLVSDLLTFPSLHIMVLRIFYLSGKDRRCFYLLGLYQQEACTAADPPGDRNVCVFLPPECKNAGNLHGKPS